MKQVTESKKKVKDQKTKCITIEATWVVGIDIGKNQLSLAIMNKTQSVVHKFGVENSFAGHKKMLEKVKEKTKGNKVLYALEPTGHYWMVLGQYFELYNRQYVLIHLLAVARSREVVKLNRGKTDPLDAKLIGMLAFRGISTRTQIPGDYWATLRFLAREFMDREKDIVREKLRIISFVETTLPDFFKVFPNPLCLAPRACLRTLANFKEAIKGDLPTFENQVRKHYTGKRLWVSRVKKIYSTLRQNDAVGLRAGRFAMFCRIINSLERLEVAEKQQEATKQSL